MPFNMQNIIFNLKSLFFFNIFINYLIIKYNKMTLEKDIKVLKLNLLIYAILMALSIIYLIISRAFTFFYLNLLIQLRMYL